VLLQIASASDRSLRMLSSGHVMSMYTPYITHCQLDRLHLFFVSSVPPPTFTTKAALIHQTQRCKPCTSGERCFVCLMGASQLITFLFKEGLLHSDSRWIWSLKPTQ
jgi:hypothetical protein